MHANSTFATLNQQEFGIQSDFTDVAWYLYLETPIKIVSLILFYNLPAPSYLLIQAILLVVMTVANFYGKPSRICWYDHLRGYKHLLLAIMFIAFFILEVSVDYNRWDLKAEISVVLDFTLLAILILSILVGISAVYWKLERKTLTAEQLEQKKKELNGFFENFVE